MRKKDTVIEGNIAQGGCELAGKKGDRRGEKSYVYRIGLSAK